MLYILVVMIYSAGQLQRVDMSAPIPAAACHRMEEELRAVHRNQTELYKQRHPGARLPGAQGSQPKIFCQPVGK